jgi:hypothetical protein
MNKLNQRNYVPLAVAALSAILIASIVAIGSGISATAQNMTGGNMTTSNLTGTMGGSMGGSEGGSDGGGSEGGSEGGSDGGGSMGGG